MNSSCWVFTPSPSGGGWDGGTQRQLFQPVHYGLQHSIELNERIVRRKAQNIESLAAKESLTPRVVALLGLVL
jgi:hypothetical protein